MDFRDSFHRGGAGEPLVLIHGFSGAWQNWKPVIPALEERHDVLAVGLAGHFGCPPFVGEIGLESAVDALERDLDATGFETAHLVGNSLGGLLAFELARRGRARSVVGLAPAGGWQTGTPQARRLMRIFKAQYRAGKLALPHAEWLLRSPLRRKLAFSIVMAQGDRVPAADAMQMLRGSIGCPEYLAILAAGERDGMPQDFEGVDCPVLLAWPEKDRLLTIRRYSERLRRLIPHAEWRVLADVGHMPMYDDPALVTRTILGWVERHAATAPPEAAEAQPA